MRILFVIDSFCMGGAEKSLVTLLNMLPKEGMEIEVMRMAPGRELEPLLPEGIKLSQVSLHAPGLVGKTRFYLSRAAMFLSHKLSRSKPHPNDRFWRFMRHSVTHLECTYDIAIAYQQGFPTAYVATRVNARRKIAWVNADVAGAGYDAEFNRPFYEVMENIVTVSDTLMKLFASRYPQLAQRIIAIPDMIEPEAIMRLSMQSDPYGDDYDASHDKRPLRLLTVARLEHIKGIDIAIEAAKQLRDSGVRFTWHFIGDGNERRTLEELIDLYYLRDRVRLLGTVANPYPWIRKCDIYIQPSRHEGYGIAIAEAMTLGRPVITTDFPVAHDHIDGTNGIIAPMSASGIADAVKQLLTHESRSKLTPRPCDTDSRSQLSLKKIIKLLA